MSDLNKSLWLKKFEDLVPSAIGEKINLTVLSECESTMKSAREFYCDRSGQSNAIQRISSNPEFLWCYALSQTQGVGRQKKEWLSPKSEGMYLSILTYKPISYQKLSGLSLAIGTSIAQVLLNYNLNPGLKWPNDVLIGGKKISGILIETFTSKVDPTMCHVVIGVGLNIKQVGFSEELNATSISKEIGAEIDYEEACLNIAVQITSDFAVYEDRGFESFIEKWRALSVMDGISVKNFEGNLIGTVKDIDNAGALILNGEDGELRIHSYDDRLQFEFNS